MRAAAKHYDGNLIIFWPNKQMVDQAKVVENINRPTKCSIKNLI